MYLFLKLLKESVRFSLQSLIVNKLRTVLSLMGITIGIFAIISVFTVVDSMEHGIRKNIETLGNNVVFIQKWPWSFDGSDYPWWKYMNRPVPKIKEMEMIKDRSQTAEKVVFMAGTYKTVEHKNRSIDEVEIAVVSEGYDAINEFEFKDGRYFSYTELEHGKPVIVVGADIAQELFSDEKAVGGRLKIFGMKLSVIGVLKKKGEDMFGDTPDKKVIIPANYAKNHMDVDYEGYNPSILVRARSMVSNDQMKDELRGIMRSIRRLKPKADDNFALNETSLLSEGFDNIFSVITIAGWVIGGFSILVGGFGIANIMFVSVKERTSIIGIQKALGAKKYFILLQFLFEATILSLIGGAVGLLLILAGASFVSSMSSMDIFLSTENVIRGLLVSSIIGLVSGFIPAYSASRLDPVEAIRSVA